MGCAIARVRVQVWLLVLAGLLAAGVGEVASAQSANIAPSTIAVGDTATLTVVLDRAAQIHWTSTNIVSPTSFYDINGSPFYEPAGTYTYTLTGSNVGSAAPGSGDMTVSLSYQGGGSAVFYPGLTVQGGSAPGASFIASPTSGDKPLVVSFSDTSTHSPTSWAWTFGDGGSSSLQNPSHTYSSYGTFLVQLTATNTYGAGSASGSIVCAYQPPSDPSMTLLAGPVWVKTAGAIQSLGRSVGMIFGICLCVSVGYWMVMRAFRNSDPDGDVARSRENKFTGGG